jgi:signal transducing adaptor molecule
VRALYNFTTVEAGELVFHKGDVIRVLERNYKEWWRGACNGHIGVSSAIHSGQA